MSDATTTAGLPPNPAPARAEAARAPASADIPPRIHGVLRVLQVIIGFGMYALRMIEQPDSAAFRQFARRYGPDDYDTIVNRVFGAMRRVLALQDVLLRRAAQGGPDLTPAPFTPSAPRAPRGAGKGKRGGSRREAPYARVPTDAEIAAELRRDTVGVVLARICRGLGIIAPDFGRADWDALENTVRDYGGNLMCFFPAMRHRFLAESNDYINNPEGPPPVMVVLPWPACGGPRPPTIPP